MKKKRKEKPIIIKYYNSLDTLPIGKWWYLLDSNDLRYLLKGEDNFDVELTDKEFEILSEVYEKLIFTISTIDLTIEKLNAKREALFIENEIFKQSHIYNKFLIADYELKNAIKKHNSLNLSNQKQARLKEISALEKYFQRSIDIWKVSTNLYYQYISDYNIYVENLNNQK